MVESGMTKEKPSTDKKEIVIDGKTYAVYKYDFLPVGTVGLSSDLYRKFMEQHED